MTRDYKALLEAGNKAQMEKLKKNGHKKNWKKMSYQEIAELIDEEYDEVFDELSNQETNWSLLRLECADLKNALNFMISLCDKELNK